VFRKFLGDLAIVSTMSSLKLQRFWATFYWCLFNYVPDYWRSPSSYKNRKFHKSKYYYNSKTTKFFL